MVDNKGIYALEIEECKSCGGRHWVIAVPLVEMQEEDDGVYSHETMCPDTGQEILLLIQVEEEDRSYLN